MGTAIKHPCNQTGLSCHSLTLTLTLSRERQSAGMSKITNDSLILAIVGVEGLSYTAHVHIRYCNTRFRCCTSTTSTSVHTVTRKSLAALAPVIRNKGATKKTAQVLVTEVNLWRHATFLSFANSTNSNFFWRATEYDQASLLYFYLAFRSSMTVAAV